MNTGVLLRSPSSNFVHQYGNGTLMMSESLHEVGQAKVPLLSTAPGGISLLPRHQNEAMVRWPEVQPTLTGGVVLRPWVEADADEVFRACQDGEIQRYTNVPVPYLRANADFFVGPFQRKNWADRSGAGFAVTSGPGAPLLGACGLVGVDLEAGRSGVGYWAAPWARGSRVATEALTVLAAWATDQVGLRELYAEVEEGNPASRRVAERAGFVLDDGAQRWEEHRGALRLFLVLVRRAGAQ